MSKYSKFLMTSLLPQVVSFLNVNKTEMLPLSSATSITAKYQNMVVEKIKICGVIFSVTDYKEMADNNFF